jgi:ParB family chromosome partitioning protein
MQLLRDDLKLREAQIAQLAELWEIREREVEYAGEWLHEKDVELQGVKGQVEDLQGRLAEARAAADRKAKEHAAAIDALLLEKVTQEKELIEAIAGGERRLHDLERRHEAARRALEEAIAALEEEKRSLGERLAAGAAELAAERERAGELEGELAKVRAAAEAAAAEAGAREEALRGEVATLREEVAERDRLLASAKRENDRLQGGLTAARHEQMVAMSELDAASDRAGALSARLAAAERERDAAWASLAVAPAPARAAAAAPPAEPREAPEPQGASGAAGGAEEAKPKATDEAKEKEKEKGE